MYTQTIYFFSTHWTLFLTYLICINVLNLPVLFLPESFFLIAFAIGILQFYIFLNFFFTASQIISDNRPYEIIDALFKRKKGLYLEFVVFFLFIGAAMCLISIPSLIISFTPFDSKLSSFLEYLNTLVFFKVFLFIGKAFLNFLFLCWIANMIYFRKGTWNSIIAGSKNAVSLKSLFFFIVSFEFVAWTIGELINYEIVRSIILYNLNLVETLIAIVFVFCYFTSSESIANK